MNITAFDVFTAIGSILGIIAFLMNFFLIPIGESNKIVWGKLGKIISLEEMQYYSESFDKGWIDNDIYLKISNLINSTRKEIDFIYFRGYSGKSAKLYLKKIESLHYECTQIIQEPYWYIPTDKKFEDKRYILDKDYFYRDSGKEGKLLSQCDKEFREHLDFLTEKVEEMCLLYRRVEKELNRLPLEQLKFW